MEILTGPARGRFLAIVLLAGVMQLDAAAPLTEAQVRAALLYNFATFVEWPDDAAAGGRPFVIGVLGADAVTDALRQLQGRPVKGRPVDVRRISGDADARRCHILYLPGGAANWQAILADLRTAPVLTVGEHDQFTRVGGVIRLYAEDSRLRFEINVTRSKKASLHVSSKLLGLAKVVREP
jgi:hypothetical protein